MTTMESLRQVDMAVFAVLMEENPWQPRTLVDPEADELLRESIRQNDLLHPPIARMQESKLQIAVGHRRSYQCIELWKAGEWPADKKMPIDVRELTDAQMALIALSENQDRAQLSPLEEIRAWKKMLTTIEGFTQETLAEALNRSKSTVSNGISLLDLPEEAIALVDEGKMAITAARTLLRIKQHPKMVLEVLKYCNRPYFGFTTGEVVNGMLHAARQSGWVRLDGLDSWEQRQVHIDLEDYAARHKEHIVKLPSYREYESKGKTDRWAVNGNTYRKENKAAYQEKQAAEEQEAKGPKPTYDKERQLADPVIVRAAAEAGVEVTNKKGTPNAKALQAAGTRGKPLLVMETWYSRFHVEDEVNDLQEPLLDRSDCAGCVNGARWAEIKRRYYNDSEPQVVVVCTNNACYQTHMERGHRRWKRHFLEALEQHDDAVAWLAQTFEESLAALPEEQRREVCLHAVGRFDDERPYVNLSSTPWADPETGKAPSHWELNDATASYLGSVRRAAKLVGVEVPRHCGDTGQTLSFYAAASQLPTEQLTTMGALFLSELLLRRREWPSAPDLREPAPWPLDEEPVATDEGESCVCMCGHSADVHDQEPEDGRCTQCICPAFEEDEDRSAVTA
ncbi:MAG: ParB/RepB/Spo0J family partition protein [Chloroflexi bacterium]|nr:ParB/RepB/Spo0J family partition protein [Chloroflexota bacterium]MYB84538.1 ParB/RepB/Spo0J family partition protein [Chloroflexota bacterium]